MYFIASGRPILEQVDVRRNDKGVIDVWIRGHTGISLSLSLDETAWLSTALSRALEEAKAAPPDAVGVLFETERGEPAAAAAEAG